MFFQLFLVVGYKSMFTSWQLRFAMLTSVSVFLKELEVWGFFFVGFVTYFPLTGVVALEGWVCAAVPAALGWVWLSHARLAGAVEKTELNRFSDQDLPSSELPARRCLVPIHVLWKFEASVGTSFTVWTRMTLRSCMLCGFGSVFPNIWDHVRKVSWKDSFYPSKRIWRPQCNRTALVNY